MLKFDLFCSTVKKLADQDLHFCHAAYVMMHGLVDMIYLFALAKYFVNFHFFFREYC